MLLELKDIAVAYGRHQVVHGVSLTVEKGELVALLGPNGVGKTSTLLAICGLAPRQAGSVAIDNKPLIDLRPAQLVRSGVVLCPQGRELFKTMTVRENLILGAITTASDKSEGLARVYELFPRLRERDRQIAGTLSGGEQQMLAIGRALMSKPRILLIDEPSTGLAPKLVEFVISLLRQLIPTHVEGILLVEQNADAALGVADRAYLMEAGLIKLHGTASALSADDTVRQLYLGAAPKAEGPTRDRGVKSTH